MNKTAKRIISSVLIFSAFAAIEPANYINLMTEKTYAATYNSSDYALLSSLDTDEGSFDFSSTKSLATGRVKSDIDEVKITAKPKDDNYKVTIDGDEKTGENSETVNLSRGLNTFRVRVEDPSGKKSSVTYSVRITRGSSSSSSNNDSDEDVYLDNITVDGDNISFSQTKNSYNVEVPENADQVRIKANPDDDNYTVTIDGTTVDDSDDYKRWVSLNKGKNVVQIKVEDNYDNDRIYTLNIYRGQKAPKETTEAGQIDEYQDSIYLDELNIYEAGAKLYFKPKVTNYDVNVAEDNDSIVIKAKPEDDDDTVRVNDDKVGSDYNKRVYLQKGKNVIKVKVTNDDYKPSDDDYEQRIYTINVYRGSSNGNSTNQTVTNNNTSSVANNNTNTINKDVKINQWVQNANGTWSYNDALGKPIMNTWSYINGKWYYFNTDGTMKTGWIHNWDGKWYYFYQNGEMAVNAKVDGYTLGYDGAMM